MQDKLHRYISQGQLKLQHAKWIGGMEHGMQCCAPLSNFLPSGSLSEISKISSSTTACANSPAGHACSHDHGRQLTAACMA